LKKKGKKEKKGASKDKETEKTETAAGHPEGAMTNIKIRLNTGFKIIKHEK
jgi:hypothetical protein